MQVHRRHKALLPSAPAATNGRMRYRRLGKSALDHTLVDRSPECESQVDGSVRPIAPDSQSVRPAMDAPRVRNSKFSRLQTTFLRLLRTTWPFSSKRSWPIDRSLHQCTNLQFVLRREADAAATYIDGMPPMVGIDRVSPGIDS